MLGPGLIQSPREDRGDLNPWHFAWGGEFVRPDFLCAGTPGTGSPSMSAGQCSGDASDFSEARDRMVSVQLQGRGIKDAKLLRAMREVPREEFVPETLREHTYSDRPLPIGFAQTISQPYIVALMGELLKARGDEKVLEIGSGSGYHAAVLSKIVGSVHSIEIVEELGRRASTVLARLGYENIHVRVGDGYDGLPEQAPFDAIVLTAAPPELPKPLLRQLRTGGRIIAPIGDRQQELQVLLKGEDGLVRERILPVRFVPMTGKAQESAVSS